MSNLEVELKLQVADAESWPKLLASPLFAQLANGRTWNSEKLEARYFDTKSGALRVAQIAYRVRREGENLVATLKGSGSSEGGLHQREEYNVKVESTDPDISVFSATPLGQRLLKVVGSQPLMPLCITAFTRQTVEVTLNGAVIEIAADQGNIIAGEQIEAILELELELKSGDVKSLFKLGAQLAKEFPLFLESKSKYHRALLLAGLEVEKIKLPDIAAARTDALINIQQLLALQPVFHAAGRDVRKSTALLLELWATL